MRALQTSLLVAALVGLSAPAFAQFEYTPPGELAPDSGAGRVDDTVYVPGMRYPIEAAPSFLNSQVYRPGGYLGPSGGQCDESNYSYPWWDNYCESRTYTMPLCPSGTGHQGQDIRPATCADNTHWAVAAEDGTITNVGSYSVSLTTADGTRHRYLHMHLGSLQVTTGQTVTRGQRLGRVSNEFGDTGTTIHLHYDIFQDVAGVGGAYVPTYMSLVRSYEELIGMPGAMCEPLPVDGGIIDDSSPCFTQHGPPASWRYVTDVGNEGQLHWTFAWDGDQSNWADWEVLLSESGTYRVEVNTVSEYAQSQEARYAIRHGGIVTELRVDLSGESRWVELAAVDFAADEDEWVAVYDNTGESLDLQRRIIADAVRLTRVAEPTEDVGVPDVGEPDVGEPDVGETDVGEPDVGEPDVGSPDASDPDVGEPDPDAMTPDASDTGGSPDVGAEDAADDSGGTPDVGGRERVPDEDQGGQEVQVGGSCAVGSPDGSSHWLVGMILALGLIGRRRR